MVGGWNQGGPLAASWSVKERREMLNVYGGIVLRNDNAGDVKGCLFHAFQVLALADRPPTVEAILD